jgi:hypothetical protein
VSIPNLLLELLLPNPLCVVSHIMSGLPLPSLSPFPWVEDMGVPMNKTATNNTRPYSWGIGQLSNTPPPPSHAWDCLVWASMAFCEWVSVPAHCSLQKSSQPDNVTVNSHSTPTCTTVWLKYSKTDKRRSAVLFRTETPLPGFPVFRMVPHSLTLTLASVLSCNKHSLLRASAQMGVAMNRGSHNSNKWWWFTP